MSKELRESLKEGLMALKGQMRARRGMSYCHDDDDDDEGEEKKPMKMAEEEKGDSRLAKKVASGEEEANAEMDSVADGNADFLDEIKNFMSNRRPSNSGKTISVMVAAGKPVKKKNNIVKA